MTQPGYDLQRDDPYPIPPWVRRWGPRFLVTALALYAVTTAIWFGYTDQVDIAIFRFGGQSLLSHSPLYDHGLTGGSLRLLFNYPPFAALLFTPLAQIPLVVLRVLTPIGNIALVLLVVRRCLQSLGVRTGGELRSLTMLGAGLLLWLEPVRTTVALGQVNLGLLALVVFDLVPISGERRWSGVGVGIAAGIKLTPLLFIPYLLITRRARAAAVATVTFLATVATGFLVAPSQAVEYWFRGVFSDLRRVADVNYIGNQSLRGMLARMNLPGRSSIDIWMIGAILLAIISLGVAARAHRCGFPILGLALCGLGSAAISPYSWGYHWVWLVPLGVFLIHRAIAYGSKPATALLAVLFAATASWIISLPSPLSGRLPDAGWINLQVGGWLGQVTSNIYLYVFLLTLVSAAAFVLRAQPPILGVSRPRAGRLNAAEVGGGGF